MRNSNHPATLFKSLKSRYLGSAITLLFIFSVFSWFTYINVTDILGDVVEDSHYQLQLNDDLNIFAESIYNTEKVVQYSSQISNEIVYKQLKVNLSKAESAFKSVENGFRIIGKDQHSSLIDLRHFMSTYQFHVNWLLKSADNNNQSAAIAKNNIDSFVNNLRPIMADIWVSIKLLEGDLQTLSIIEKSHLSTVKNGVALMLLLGLVFTLGFLAINFLAINSWLLSPLSKLSDVIKSNNDSLLRGFSKVVEMNGLVDAIETRCSSHRERENQLEYQIFHDPLTNLPNRVLLKKNLQSAIDRADKNAQCFTLLMINLDRFKKINDTLGHQIGDKVLCEISKRFRKKLSEDDLIARLGGDEFAVLLNEADTEKARVTAKRMLECFNDDLYLEDHHFNIGGSIGMAVYPWHAKTDQELLQRADVAMYFAKRKNFGYAIYDKSEDKHDIRQLGFEIELRDAINNNELSLHYQPKIDVKTKQIVSVEALLRWEHGEHGFIPAEEISLLAEKTGLISQLSKWVVKNAIEQLARWYKKGFDMSISINLSVWNLQDPAFFSYVENVLNKMKIPAKMITFEITESAVMSDPESAMKTLQQLSDIGANLSIDDYGTGFSSLQYLKILPVDEIKIDKSFVTDMVNYENDAVIVRSIIDLSHNLGLTVVAEGVETQEVYDVLEILRCDIIQGYHVSRPIPPAALEAWISQNDNHYSHKKGNVTYLYQ